MSISTAVALSGKVVLTVWRSSEIMIIIAGYLTIDPQRLTEFEDAIAAVAGTIRAEDGCHHYSVLAEDRSKGLVNLTEVWRDKAALDIHLAQPWVKDLLARIGPLIRSMDAPAYDAVPIPDRKN